VKAQHEHPVLAGEWRLWASWCQSGDEAARNEIVLHYLSYARALAAQIYGRRMHDEFEFDEYVQLATVGLMEAVNRFDPSRNVLFKTFATRRIVGSVLSGLSNLSERQQQAGVRRRIATERLESIRTELAAAERPEDLLRALTEIGVGLALGLMLEGTGMIANEGAALPDNAYSRLELRQFQKQVSRYVEQLLPREQDVIRRHYFHGIAFGEIAMELGLTKGRISQLHHQGLAHLRKLIRQEHRCDLVL
jgi:RNA polymerase sigma factor for flagellar operon FliA